MKKLSLVDQFITSLLNTYATVDADTWFPWSAGRLVPYYYSLYCERVANLIRGLEKRGITSQKVVDLFMGGSVLLDELDMIASYLGLGVIKVSKRDARVVFHYFTEALKAQNPTDPYRLNGKNLILRDATINLLLKDKKWEVVNREKAKALGKLIASLHALYCSIYTDSWPASGVEFHGPYEVVFEGKKRVLLARDYFDIAPAEVWPSFAKVTPKSVRILTIYKPAHFFIDFYGNVTCDGNLIELLEAFSVISDGRYVIFNKINQLNDEIGQNAINQYEYFRQLPFEDLKRKFLETHQYGLKPLFDLANISWKPTKAIYESIKNKPLLSKKNEWSDLKRASLILQCGLRLAGFV